MKIAYILTNYPCPSETFIQREIRELESQGFEISVFAASGYAVDCSAGYNNACYRCSIFSPFTVWSIIRTILKHPLRLIKLMILVIRLAAACPKEAMIVLFNFYTICFFARVIQKNHIEHIHAGFFSWPACISLGVSCLTKLNFSIAAHARDIYVEAGAVRVKAEKAEFINCCNKAVQERLKSIINRKDHNKVILNYHGIEINQAYRKFNNLSNRSDFIIAVGRLVEKKGFDRLIESFSKVSQNFPGISLIIVGDGSMKKELESIIAKTKLSDRVYLTGWFDHDRVLKLMSMAKILVVPSIIDADGDRDGIPNVVLEAFSTGTPVIASDLAGISEAVIHKKTGLLVKPGNIKELSAATEELLRDESSMCLLTDNAKKMLSDNFNIENNCGKLAEIFEKGYHSENRQIKIAHVVEGFVGGMSTYLRNVLVLLKDAGFDVTLIYSCNRRDGSLSAKIKKLKKQGIDVRMISMTRAVNPLVDFYGLIRLAILFKKEGFDIVHTHCSKAGAVGRIAAWLSGIGQIYHSSHCFAFLRCGNFITKKIYLNAERFLAKITSQFIAVSDCDAESAKRWNIFDEDKIKIVNNGLLANKNSSRKKQSDTISQIRESLDIPAECFVVATVCRLVEYKGLFTFIEAARLCKSKAVFVIAGDGPLKSRLKKHISKANLSGKVKLVGHVCDIERVYRISDVVILSSTMEAQPFTLLEAMREKCAIIASDVPGNRELLIEDRGVLVKPDGTKFASAIDYLLGDKVKRLKLTRKAYRYFHNRHRLEEQVQKLIDIYCNSIDLKERNINIAG